MRAIQNDTAGWNDSDAGEKMPPFYVVAIVAIALLAYFTICALFSPIRVE